MPGRGADMLRNSSKKRRTKEEIAQGKYEEEERNARIAEMHQMVELLTAKNAELEAKLDNLIGEEDGEEVRQNELSIHEDPNANSQMYHQ